MRRTVFADRFPDSGPEPSIRCIRNGTPVPDATCFMRRVWHRREARCRAVSLHADMRTERRGRSNVVWGWFIFLLSGIAGMTAESGESFFGLSSDRCCSPGAFRFCPGTNGKSLLKRSVSLREEAPEKNGSRGENRAAAGFSFGRERGLHATGRNGYFPRRCLEQTGSAPDITFCTPCRASGVPDRGGSLLSISDRTGGEGGRSGCGHGIRPSEALLRRNRRGWSHLPSGCVLRRFRGKPAGPVSAFPIPCAECPRGRPLGSDSRSCAAVRP